MGRSGLSTVLKSLGLLLFTLLVLIFMMGGSFSPVRQISGDDSSVLGFTSDKTTQFLIITVVIVIVMGLMGGGLAFLFRGLTREVTIAKEQENIPTNPLEYRNYGHPMVLALIAGFAGLLLLIYFMFDLMPTQASNEAIITDRIFGIAYLVVAILFGLVMGLFIHSLLYFRAEPGDMSDGKHFHGNLKLELTWTIIPLIFVLILGGYTVTQYNDLVEEKEGEVAVGVVGSQWNWKFIYPVELFYDDESYAELDQSQRDDFEAAGGVALGELVLLADQPVRLDLVSDDVIHSFWVPEMRVKQDVVPGVETVVRYTPTLPGEYKVRCAELCGLTHWDMLAPVEVKTQADYDKWISEVQDLFGDPREAGRLLWEANCQTCHTSSGASATGPTWKDLAGSERQLDNGDTVIADLEYVTSSIYNPNAQIVSGYNAGLMPSNFSGSISELQVKQIFTYMCTISENADSLQECVELIAEAEERAAAAEATDGSTDTSDVESDASDETQDDTADDSETDTTDDTTEDTSQPEDNTDATSSDETDTTEDNESTDNDILG